MSEMKCPQCGAPIDPNASECKFCGEKLASQQVAQQQPTMQQPTIIVQQPMMQQPYNPGINPNWPVKSKVTAGVLALLLGGLGIHKFYLGKIGMGILYIVFCWTFIPALVAFVEGILYLTSSDEQFQLKHQVRII